MPIIVEDGRCPPFANSYVSLAEAGAYLVARGLWPETPLIDAPSAPVVEPEEPGEAPDAPETQSEDAGEPDGEKRTDVTAEPALMDLAQLNKRHWQATSSQFELMEFVRRPPWFGKNLGELDPKCGKTKFIFGPGKLSHSTNADSSLQSVGVDSGSVVAGRQELQDLEDRMAIYGLQLLQPKTGAITATESIRDSEENNSTLKAWALGFQDFLENCFRFAALWLRQKDGPSVIVNTDFANETDVAILLELQRSGIISANTLLNLVKGKGLLPDDFIPEDEAAKIANELMANGVGATPLGEDFKAGL